MRDKLLVITSEADTHAARVGVILEQRGIDWIRLNTENLFTNTVIDVDPRTATGTVRIKDSGLTFRIEDIGFVWYRKPDTPGIDHLSLLPGEERFFEAESYENLLSLYSVLQDRSWLNNPFATRLAHRRFWQLQIARRVGFRTVRSTFSNSKESVLGFARSLNGSLAIKSLSALSVSSHQGEDVTDQYGVLTRALELSEIETLSDSIELIPTFLQEYIDKDYDLRVVWVAGRVFACRIHSQDSDITRHDFRISARTSRHELVDIDQAMAKRMEQFMELLNIDFGCFDFVEVADGDPYFLECNPNGQWLWIQERVGAGIDVALADYIERKINDSDQEGQRC